MKRMMVLVPITALALSACSDRPRMWRESEIQSIAEDFADAAASDGVSEVDEALDARIDELDRRIAELERENESQAAMIEALTRHQQAMGNYLNTFD